MTHPTPTVPVALPDPVRAFLRAHTARDADAVLAVCAPDVEVVDDGRTHRGEAEVRAFVDEAGGTFTYTTELVGAEQLDQRTWVVRQRLVGDLPGGVLDLALRFRLADGLVGRLEITA